MLTHKQEEFCRLVVQGASLSEAYRQSYHPPNMGKKTVNEKASRLRARGKIGARILELQAPAVAKVKANYEQWLMEIEHAAFCDSRKFFDDKGQLIPIPELGDGSAAGLAGFEVTEIWAGEGENRKQIGQTSKIKLGNKLSALELFGKATGYYQEKTEAPQSALEMASTEFLISMVQELREKKARSLKVVNE